MLPWKLWKRHILPASQNLLSVYFSLAKFQLVSCNLSLAMIWQRTYTHKLPKLCSATLTTAATLPASFRKDLEFKSPLNTQEVSQIVKATCRRLIRARINECHRRLDYGNNKGWRLDRHKQLTATTLLSTIQTIADKRADKTAEQHRAKMKQTDKNR